MQSSSLPEIPSTTPYISVVIPAYNEEKYLPACLHAINQQEDAPPYEVIVVDNASTDGTADVARQFGAHVVTEPRKGVARARQSGFESARGEITVSADADTRVAPRWLAQITAHFREDPTIGAVYGPVNWYDGRPMERWALKYAFTWAQWLGHRTRHEFWWGSNFAVRREVFEKAGGFPVDWPSWEDIGLSARVGRVARTCFDRHLVVYASSRRSQEGWLTVGRVALTNAAECIVLRRPPSLPMTDMR